MGFAIPTLNSVSGARARSEASALASNIRATRGHAAAAGETCRIVFCLGGCDEAGSRSSSGADAASGSSYRVECSKGHVAMAREDVRNGAMDVDDVDEKSLTPSEKARLEITRKNRFTAAKGLPDIHLQSLRIAQIWTAHQAEPYTKGKAYLYFHPSGRTEQAHIQLQDGDEWYALDVSPLSGRVKMQAERVDFKPPREEED